MKGFGVQKKGKRISDKLLGGELDAVQSIVQREGGPRLRLSPENESKTNRISCAVASGSNTTAHVTNQCGIKILVVFETMDILLSIW